jgi:hypothetical protein
VPEPRLEEVFKTNGVPTFTFVEPREYTDLLLNLRTPGRGLVIEGPSGIGKTTAVENAIRKLGVANSVQKLSARSPRDVEYIQLLPDMRSAGLVIVDDFHKLDASIRRALADFMKRLADEEGADTKIVVIGINRAGENLVSFAHDLLNRLDIVRFESNPDHKVGELVEKGATAMNVDLNVAAEIVAAAQGSFYLAQMLSREVCKRAGVLERCEVKVTTTESFEAVRADVWDKLALLFRTRCERFSRGNRMKKEGRAPYLHILRWLAEGTEWTLELRDAVRTHPNMRGSVGQVVDKGYLQDLVQNDEEISAVMHYDADAEQLTVDDPQFIFFIRNIPWKSFAATVGFMALEFESRYDFGLSFAGEDRALARRIAELLQEAEVEVFYDHNEQHRIIAVDVEEYLRPIYQSEARFIVALLSRSYPKKIWTKFESEQFKQRFGNNAVIPIWFTDAPPGLFDETRKYGGFTYNPAEPLEPQAQEFVELLLRKLADERQVS